MLRVRLRSFLVVLLFVFIVSFICRINILNNSFVLDDFVLIVNNSFIQSTQNFFTVINPVNFFYVLPIRCGARPITVATYIIDYSLWNLNPFGYHLSNLLIHCLNVLLVFFLAYFLINRNKIFFASVVALFFSLHPIQSEVVTVIGFRANILFVFFALLALNTIFLFRFCNKKHHKFLFVLVFIFSILSLLSKENAIILPFIFMLIYFIFYRNSTNKKISIISFFIISFIFLFFCIERFPVPLYYSIYPELDTNLIPISSISLYFKVVFTALVDNLIHVVYPVNLCVDYTLTFSIYKIIIMFLLAIVSVCFFVYRKSKYFIFALLFSLITYLPVSNLIPLINTIADRYIYMSMIGIAFMFGLIIIKIFEINKSLAYIFVFLLMILFAFSSFERGETYSNSYLLYSDAIQKSPNNVRTVYNMGVAFFANNEYDKAIRQFEKVFKINPFYFTDRNWFLIALSYDKLGNKDMALKYYHKAFLLNPSDDEIKVCFLSQFETKQDAIQFILQHTKYISANVIKAIEN